MVPPPPPPPSTSISASPVLQQQEKQQQQEQQQKQKQQVDVDQHKWMGIPFLFNQEQHEQQQQQQSKEALPNSRESFIDLLEDFFNPPSVEEHLKALSLLKEDNDNNIINEQQAPLKAPTNILQLPPQITIPSLGTWMYKFPRKNINKILPLPYLPMDQSKKRLFWYDIWKGILMWTDGIGDGDGDGYGGYSTAGGIDSNSNNNNSRNNNNSTTSSRNQQLQPQQSQSKIRQSTKVVAFQIERKSITPPPTIFYQEGSDGAPTLPALYTQQHQHRKEVFVNMILIRTEPLRTKKGGVGGVFSTISKSQSQPKSHAPPPPPPPPLLLVPPNNQCCEAWFQALSLGVRLNKDRKGAKIRMCLEK